MLFDGFERVDLHRPLRPERNAKQRVGLGLDDADRGQGSAPLVLRVLGDALDRPLRLGDAGESLFLDPATPTRTPARLRTFLRRWGRPRHRVPPRAGPVVSR